MKGEGAERALLRLLSFIFAEENDDVRVDRPDC
jgi:hypothetical protein